MLATATATATAITRGPGQMSNTSTGIARGGAQGAMWEEQIVPTLKKRLESESAYLANRLSASSYIHHDTDSDPPSHTRTGTVGRESTNSPRQYPWTAFPSQIPVASSSPSSNSNSNHKGANPPALSPTEYASGSRSRTKSGPMNGYSRKVSGQAAGEAGVGLGIDARPERARERESGAPFTSASSSLSNSIGNGYGHGSGSGSGQTDPTKSRIPSASGSMSTSPDASSPPLGTAASRIPTRPRSKSQLGPRRPSPSSLPPPLPSSFASGAGAGAGSSRPGVSRASSSTTTTTSTPAAAYVAGRATAGGRGSPDFSGRFREALVKNELPPFRVLPEEALRIAERGHDLNAEEERRGDSMYGWEGADDGIEPGEKRKRAITKRGGNGTDQTQDNRLGIGRMTDRKDSSGSDGSGSSAGYERRSGSGRPVTVTGGFSNLSRSTTEVGLGLGHPARRFAGGPTSTSTSASKQRSTSNRPSTSQTTTASSAPRSASLNILSSSPTIGSGTPNSRLGVAAHLIPPESTYTPPKGTDWDDVVLPAVAKKLGMTDDNAVKGGGGGEEDLAVEWDRDGTPIRWVKRKGGKMDGLESTLTNNSANTPNEKRSAFSPSFEPSPENPLYRKPSSSSNLRSQRSREGIELAPIRTSSARSRALDSHQPSSPAPFSSLAPHPNSNVNGNGNGAFDPSPAPSPRGSLSRKPSLVGAVTRKPSLLRKTSQAQVAEVAKQDSSRSLRTQYIHGSAQSYQQRFGVAPHVSGMSGQPMGMTTKNGMGQPPTPGTTHHLADTIYAKREGGNGGQSQRRRDGDDDEGTHGKGCGCVIM